VRCRVELQKMAFTFIDLFAGIGGIKIGFEKAGFIPLLSNDIDPYCKITFDYNFSRKQAKGGLFPDSDLFLEDIKNLTSKNLPKKFDILTGGFPCQAFSIAGYRKGFHDKGRGDLFFEIIRILKESKPKAFLLENVKNLKTHDNGNTLKIIYEELENAGYHVTDLVMNTKDYANIPQNRERIYIVGFKTKKAFNKFKFPQKKKLRKTIGHFLEKNPIDDKYYYKGKPLHDRIKNDVIRKDTAYQWRRKYVRENKNNVCPTLTANMGTGGHNVPIILDDVGIRKLTPRECANLQGFPKSFKLPRIPDYQLYKQFGNSVSIPVITSIAKEMKRAMGGV
jgi:DNA (cytosine-5)-methyltransferase 1